MREGVGRQRSSQCPRLWVTVTLNVIGQPNGSSYPGTLYIIQIYERPATAGAQELVNGPLAHTSFAVSLVP
jgi:hypothetical protein